MTNPPTPASPVYAQINFVGQQVTTSVSPGVGNDMLLVGIAHLTAQLAVRINGDARGVIPINLILDGITQKIREIAPHIVPAVQPMAVPQEPGRAP